MKNFCDKMLNYFCICMMQNGIFRGALGHHFEIPTIDKILHFKNIFIRVGIFCIENGSLKMLTIIFSLPKALIIRDGCNSKELSSFDIIPQLSKVKAKVLNRVWHEAMEEWLLSRQMRWITVNRNWSFWIEQSNCNWIIC